MYIRIYVYIYIYICVCEGFLPGRATFLYIEGATQLFAQAWNGRRKGVGEILGSAGSICRLLLGFGFSFPMLG